MNSSTLKKTKTKPTDEIFFQLKRSFFFKQHLDGQNKEKQSFGKIIVQLTLN